MPSKILSTGSHPRRPKPTQQKGSVLILIRFADRCPYLEVWADPRKVQAHITSTLYAPNASLETEKNLEELMRLRLPTVWRRFLDDPETRLLCTENIVPLPPSEEARRLWRLDLLKAVQELPKFFLKGGR